MFLRFVGFSWLVLSCLMLSGCPVTVKVEVINDTDSEIAVVYSTGYESRIAAGESKEEIYKSDCLRIKYEGQLYEYQPVRPPEEYFDAGMFSSSISAIFTREKEFKIYLEGGGSEGEIKLKRGCSKL